MSGYRLLDPAAIELTSAATFYEEYTSNLGATFLDEWAIELIVDIPDAWSLVTKRIRRFHLRRFPYSLLYSIVDGNMVIISVFHQHRRPNSWRENLG